MQLISARTCSAEICTPCAGLGVYLCLPLVDFAGNKNGSDTERLRGTSLKQAMLATQTSCMRFVGRRAAGGEYSMCGIESE